METVDAERRVVYLPRIPFEMIIPGAHALQILPEDYPGFLIAILPPGAFFILGLMIAGRNWMEERANQRLLLHRRKQQEVIA